MTAIKSGSPILEGIASSVELPDSAYQKAEKRYQDLGEWFERDESLCSEFEPHIFPQGSFRLGTAIRPLHARDEYDLDLACKLQEGILKSTHTQEFLKTLVGKELENYRNSKNIKAPKEEKHRCWRLYYQDDLSFHMDIVPCIPEDELRRHVIFEAMMRVGEEEELSGAVSQLTVSITDDRHSKYDRICSDWNISNPEGYARWFEGRMKYGFSERLIIAKVDAIPSFNKKLPLQRAIQILKRHRDNMFKNFDDGKPISVIITTLAAKAYHGELDLYSALNQILSEMGNYVNSSKPKIPNPVNPEEDFADRWEMPRYKHLNLEKNFWDWLRQVKSDIDIITSSNDVDFLSRQIFERFAVNVRNSDLRSALGLASGVISVESSRPKEHVIKDPPRPWLKDV